MRRVPKKLPAASKHGALSATDIVPRENQADFQHLHHQACVDIAAGGPTETVIVSEIARLTWHKQSWRVYRHPQSACGSRKRKEEHADWRARSQS